MAAKLDQKMGELKIADPTVATFRHIYAYGVGFTTSADVVSDSRDLKRFVLHDGGTRCVPLGHDSKEVPDIVLKAVLVQACPNTGAHMYELRVHRRGFPWYTSVIIPTDGTVNPGFTVHEGKFLLLSVENIGSRIENGVLCVDLEVYAAQ